MNDRITSLLSTILFTAILLLLLAGCTPDPEDKTFSKYDFSFQYPGDYTLREFNIVEDDGNITGSQIQVTPKKGIGGLQVNWVTTWMYYELDDNLEMHLKNLEEAESIENVERGEFFEGEKDDFRMVYQYYTVTPKEGNSARGIAAIFYHRTAAKLITLFTTNDVSLSDEEILKVFEDYLESFTFEVLYQ